MKFFTIAALGILLIGCSSAQEKHQERQEEARSDYRKTLDESNARYDRDVIEEDKEAAKEMIDEADSVDVDGRRGRIRIED